MNVVLLGGGGGDRHDFLLDALDLLDLIKKTVHVLVSTLEVPLPDGQEGGLEFRPPLAVREDHLERLLQVLMSPP